MTFWLRRGLPLVGVLAVGVVLLGVVTIEGPGRAGSWSPYPRRRAAPQDRPDPPLAARVPWRAWRERLTLAHAARREGAVCAALEGYDAIGSSSLARARDVDDALLWAARLRLGLGEFSAVLALRSFIQRCEDPALLARAVRVSERSIDGMEGTVWSSPMRDAGVAARAKLRAIAAHQTGEGERARRWLRSLSSQHR